MEAETPVTSQPTIDDLHSQTVASSPIETAPAAVVEALDDPQALPVGGANPDAALCEEVIGQCCEAYSESVQEGFIETLEPIVGHDEAKSVADMAAMPPHLQKAIATSGTRLAEKYGVTKYVSHEGILVVSILLYMRSVNKARKACEAIVEKAKQAQEKADAEKK